MPLAAQSLNPIPPVGVPLTCHVAVWYWAAQQAQAQGLTPHKATLATLQNIAGIANGPQGAMLALVRSGNWNINVLPQTPPAGTVLLWTGGATHSAVVSGNNAIRGYNQVAQFPAINHVGLTTGTINEIGAAHRQVFTIAENTIVTAAGNLGL